MSGSHSFASSSAPHPKFDVALFIFRIDLLLLFIFALYVVSILPRALVCWFHPSECLNGIFLRSGGRRARKERKDNTSMFSNVDPSRSAISSSYGSVCTLVRMSGNDKSSSIYSPPITPLPRSPRKPSRCVPRWTTILRPGPTLAYALNFRISPGFSFVKLLVLIIYSAVILYACLFRSNPITDPVRGGFVAVSQIPIVVALAGKTNCLSWLCGVGYEKLQYLHRFSGYVIVIVANVHSVGFVYKWALKGTFLQKLLDPTAIYGFCALGAMNLIFIFSLSFVRNRMYNLFFAVHMICGSVLLFTVYMHMQTVSLYYILAAVGLYVFDHFVRFLRTRYTTAWLTPKHALNGGTTLIHIPSLGAGWRAGQHVRVRVVTSGWWANWFDRARPFTIAAGSGCGGMILSIKANGRWTRNLLRTASETSNAQAHPYMRSTNSELGLAPARKVRVVIEGPYGGPGYTFYSAYSGAVLVAGGSGISYVMGVLDDMLQKHASGRSRLRTIEVIWSITDTDSLYSLLPALTSLMQPRVCQDVSLFLRFSVHWTRVSARPHRMKRVELPAGMYLRAGRPDIHEALHGVIAGVCSTYLRRPRDSSDRPNGVVIGTCGPPSLVDEAARAVGHVNWMDWRDVGGVESIEEVFWR